MTHEVYVWCGSNKHSSIVHHRTVLYCIVVCVLCQLWQHVPLRTLWRAAWVLLVWTRCWLMMLGYDIYSCCINYRVTVTYTLLNDILYFICRFVTDSDGSMQCSVCHFQCYECKCYRRIVILVLMFILHNNRMWQSRTTVQPFWKCWKLSTLQRRYLWNWLSCKMRKSVMALRQSYVEITWLIFVDIFKAVSDASYMD